MDMHVENPLVRGALTVFPVFNGQAVTARGYDLGTGSPEVTERAGAPMVTELVVTDRGPGAALLPEGELPTGGRQDRVVTRPVLLAPGGTHARGGSLHWRGRTVVTVAVNPRHPPAVTA